MPAERALEQRCAAAEAMLGAARSMPRRRFAEELHDAFPVTALPNGWADFLRLFDGFKP